MNLKKLISTPQSEYKRILKIKLYNLAITPFRFGISTFCNIYLAYIPDAFLYSSTYPEFKNLFNKFKKHNAQNNTGDMPRLISFMLNSRQILDEGIAGDFAELGVWRGNTAAILAQYAAGTTRKVYLFDTYTGFDEKDLQGIDAQKEVIFNDTSIELVKEVVEENSQCVYVKGYFPASVEQTHKESTYALVSLDCDLYEPMRAGLDFFYPRMSKGGIFFLHDYSSTRWTGAKKAIDEFCKSNDEFVVLMPDKSGSAFLRKTK